MKTSPLMKEESLFSVQEINGIQRFIPNKIQASPTTLSPRELPSEGQSEHALGEKQRIRCESHSENNLYVVNQGALGENNFRSGVESRNAATSGQPALALGSAHQNGISICDSGGSVPPPGNNLSGESGKQTPGLLDRGASLEGVTRVSPPTAAKAVPESDSRGSDLPAQFISSNVPQSERLVPVQQVQGNNEQRASISPKAAPVSSPATKSTASGLRFVRDICERNHGGNEFSKQANKLCNKEAQKAKILEALKGKVMTCQDLEDLTGLSHQSCSARISEAKRDKQISVCGKGLTRSGSGCAVYSLNSL